MVSIMDVESNRPSCDNRVILSQSAVSQKSIDLDLSPKSTNSATKDEEELTDLSALTGSDQQQHLSHSKLSTTLVATPAVSASCSNSIISATNSTNATETDLAKRTMKLDLVDTSSNPVRSMSTASSSASAASTTQSTTSTSVVTTTTTAIIMKHRKLKERTFSDDIGSPKSPASTSGAGRVFGMLTILSNQTMITTQVEVVDDRKALRDALYQGIFHRHRRTIFAVGSFLRMLKSRNSSYNTIRSSSEGEDDTR
ncbi:uncharacterized protein LOC131210506 isoform X1 [Anopheles bellator]|uniref:uncharacterized protein LOC131210506 isoform X1 n=1 Tax=Anopheles bellator TaxID=139047 RepID=UPI002648A56C|nr:uncharacterized protein LOC131210506 isoform X1 [Anopheles bellator]